MTTQRTPRRLVTLVRFLEGKLKDPNVSERVKMMAADRLTSIYLQIEQTKERAAIATARAEARQAEAQAAKGQPTAPAPAPEQPTESAEPDEAAMWDAVISGRVKQRG